MTSHHEAAEGQGAHTIHFVGIAGSGMSALAQLAAARGYGVSGSDRAFDQGRLPEIKRQFERHGFAIHRQDGSGINPATAAIVTSSAVEDSVPDVVTARERQVTIFLRSEFLASLAQEYRSLAVAGTSGKTTVTAMIGHILTQAGLDPTVVNGGTPLDYPEDAGLGNARIGGGDVMVYEADESDGSLFRYHPKVAIVTNLARDHFEEDELLKMFGGLVSQTAQAAILPDALAERIRSLGLERLPELRTFSLYGGADRFFPIGIKQGGWDSSFQFQDVEFRLKVPGQHNVLNAVAAVLAAQEFGVAPQIAAQALQSFPGVARRLELIGEVNRIRVVDDYAHNPAKLDATLRALRPRCRNLHVVFQPHGYRPARFMREALPGLFRQHLRAGEKLIIPEIFYAGGTAVQDISSRDLVADLNAAGVAAEYVPSLFEAQRLLLDAAHPGDIVAVVGARNPDLPVFAEGLLQAMARMA